MKLQNHIWTCQEKFGSHWGSLGAIGRQFWWFFEKSEKKSPLFL